MSAEDYLGFEGFEYGWLIEGILPERGRLLLTAAAKGFKTWWLLCVCLVAAAGHCRFLGWSFGRPRRVLFVQGEMDDGQVQERIRLLRQFHPADVDVAGALSRLFIRVFRGHPINLNSPGDRAALDALVERTRPELIVLDPFAALFCGLNENASDQVATALAYLTSLADRFGAAVVLAHHHGKGGGKRSNENYRGSSVMPGWPEVVIELGPSDRAGVVPVSGLFRCCAGPDAPIRWKAPRAENVWWSDLEEHEMAALAERDAAGLKPCSRPKPGLEKLRAVLDEPMHWRDLNEALQRKFSVQRSTAARWIDQAKQAGVVEIVDGLYLPLVGGAQVGPTSLTGPTGPKNESHGTQVTGRS